MCHGNIANLYLRMGNIDLAKEHIDKAIELTEDGTLECADNYVILVISSIQITINPIQL